MTTRTIVVATGQTGPSGALSGGLDDLSDVTITAAASGDILRHNGSAWVDAVGTTHFDAAGSAAAAQAASQPLDGDLTAVAALSPTNDDVLQRKAGAWTNRTIAQLVTDLGLGSVYQPLDTDLTAIAALTSAADKGIQFTGSGTAATYDLTAAGKALLDDADASAQRTTLGLGTAALISSTAGGDLSGTLPSPTVAKINGITVTGTPSVGHVPTATSASAATWQAAAGGLGVSDKLVLASTGRAVAAGRYYDTGRQGGAYSTTMSTSTNWITLVPWVCPQDMTADRIGIYSSSVTGEVRCGIYTSSSGAPSTLLVDSGAITVGSAGVKEATISQALTGGTLYFLATLANANLIISGVTTQQLSLQMGSATLGAAHAFTVAGSQTYGALPASPPALSYDASTTAPLVAVRAS